MEMKRYDPSLANLVTNVWLRRPYVIYFRINDQESFSVRNLTLGEFLPLKHNDEYTFKYVLNLIESGAITNSDEKIEIIARSTDNSKFTPMEISSVEEDMVLSQVANGMVLLDALDTMQNNDHGDFATPGSQSPTSPSSVLSMVHPEPVLPSKNHSIPCGASTVMNTPPPEPLIFTKKNFRGQNFPTAQTSDSESSQSPECVLRSTSPSTLSVSAPSTNSPKIQGTVSLPLAGSCGAQSSTVPLVVTSSARRKSIPSPENTLENRKPKLKSLVWDSFTKMDATTARCKFCTKTLKHNSNTTNLRQHLLRKHSLHCLIDSSKANGMKRKSVSESATSNKQLKKDADPDDLPLKDKEIALRKTVLQTIGTSDKNEKIDVAFQRAHSFTHGGPLSEKITNTILFMLAADNLPLSTVDNIGFRAVMKAAAPLYTMPSRRTITRLMDDKYEVFQSMLKRDIVDKTALTLTCDIWSDISNRGYLGVTVHYLVNNSMSSGCLGVFPLENNHTAQYISEVLVSTIEFFGINNDNITAVVTDNGSNIKKAIFDTFGTSRHVSCFAHVLSHIVPDSISTTCGVETIITKMKQIVTLTKRSVVVTDELRRLQIRDGKTEATALKFKQDVPTRWNSTLVMIERFLELHEYVYPITLKCSGPVELLTREELDVLRDIVLILKPVENVITECGGDTYVTSSLIIPIIRCMNVAVEKCLPSTPIGKHFQANLLSQSQRRFKDYESIEMLAIATILDPRFKKLHFQKPILYAAAVRKIDAIVKSQSKTKLVPISEDAENNSKIANGGSVWSFHDQLIISTNQTMNYDGDDLNLELKQYLAQPVVSRSENPIQYWETSKIAYPKLYSCALKYLSIVATSVPSERLFSKAGAIKAERRSRLTGTRLNKLVFLGSISKNYWGIP